MDGRSPYGETSSSQANATRPAAAGQRPSRRGYASGSASGLRRSRPHARPTARHGLNAENTSPNRTETGTSPSQKIT